MEQPGSDQENFDSEASLSSESLLEEPQRSEPDGRGSPSHQRSRPKCLPKPSELSLRRKVSGGRLSLRQLSPPNSTSSSSSSSSSPSSCRDPLQRRTPIIPHGSVRLPHGVLPQASSASHPPSATQALQFLVRRQERSGRRKESTQSLYFDGSEGGDLMLTFSSCPPSTASSSISISTAKPTLQNQDTHAAKSQRRFSDPDIPYMDDDV
ncbi:putative protein TPRXL [Notothenia coriiceps]|uniref:Uncharacterized protein n=1 Tax=Notothenia coriiceps TaxID=8208 RepID=A0A6I9PEE3_9TELE|nr:PREDICTED: putative protein TPRXL [Notothenia coriiceps]